MNRANPSPEELIRKLSVPSADPRRMDAARKAALTALASGTGTVRPPLSPPRLRLWSLAACTVASALAALLVWLYLPRQQDSAGPSAAAGHFDILPENFEDIGRLFSGQLSAVICGENGVELRLAETAYAAAADQSVQIILSAGNRRSDIYTYSGRDVNADFNGKQLSLTPLVDADGRVLVLTPDRVYDDTSPSPDDGDLKITATLISRK
jgi:hypothetical protein